MDNTFRSYPEFIPPALDQASSNRTGLCALVVREQKVSLHSFDDHLYGLQRFGTVSRTEFNTPDCPIGVKTRLRRLALNNNTDKPSTLRI